MTQEDSGHRFTVAEAVNYASNGLYQAVTVGTVGNFVTVIPTKGDYQIRQMIVNAPLAGDSATLKIAENDITNLLFDGFLQNRDGDNSIRFPVAGTATAWFVEVGAQDSGSGEVFVLVRHN